MVDKKFERLARSYVLEFLIVRRDEWLRRPRIDPEIFWQVWLQETSNQSLESHGATPEQSVRLLQETSRIVKQLGWSRQRLVLFKHAIAEYRQKPTIESYLRVRGRFPELEIHANFLKLSASRASMSKEFREQGINDDLVDGCLMAEEPAIDTLCLSLMERMVRREKISKNKPGHIQKRRAAISDALVNYLIVMILESIDWATKREVRIPASLVVLIRHQLAGNNPDLHVANITKQQLFDLARFIAEKLPADEKLSINKLASIARVPRSTAARYLKNEEFQDGLALYRYWYAQPYAKRR